MTAIAPPQPPTSPPLGTQPRTGAPQPPSPQTRLGRLRAEPTFNATVALTVLTLVTGLGCGRLFAHGSWVWPVTVAAVVAHAAALWCRRRDISTALSGVITLAVTVLTSTWTILGHATAYGVPIPHTVRVAVHDLGLARDAFQVVKAPTNVLPGFVIALVLAVGIAAFMADWAAFRLQTPVEALAPAFTLFVFTSALADGNQRLLAVMTFVAAALAFVAVHGASARVRIAWFGGRAAAGPGAIAQAAALLGAAALTAGVVLGPALPGARDKPLVHYKNRGPAGPTSRTTISPLVEIRTRLVEQTNTEVFTVDSAVGAYWRLTSLDSFNGAIWQSNTKYRNTSGALGTAEPLISGVPSSRLTQAFRVRALASIWLPAAFRPQRVGGIHGVSYNADTASLITEDETTDGYAYTVTSAVPDLTPSQLETAPAQAPAAIAARYLELPNLAPRIRNEALRVVRDARASTPYDQARALQDYFRSGRFTYDLSVPAGHGQGALERFLFVTRRGYCEQFAGTYAVLARSIGLPARVAVGFTPGERRADGFHVLDRHAHAWPEVYLHGFGWVAFEPTPGRGAPGDESYTGVPEQQDGSPAPGTATTAPAPPTSAADDATPSTVPPDVAADLNAGAHHGRRVPSGPMLWLSVLLAAAVAYGAGVPLLLYLGTRRSLRAASPGQAVSAAWRRATTALAQAGIRRRPAETITEFASRAAAAAGLQPEPARALRALGRDMAVTCYGNVDTDADTAARATAAADLVVPAVSDQVSTAEQVRWWLDLRRAVRALRTAPEV